MNLRQITRVAVCAALVALCVAGAGWFWAQPVTGRESKPGTMHGAAALEQLKRDGQYESLQAAMDEARFSVSHVARTPLGRAAWHAPNAAAGYGAYVTETGVSIAINGDAGDESFVSLSLHSIGYGAAMRAVEPGKVSGGGRTINLERDGLREWYVNGADGLEHGFTLAAPPGARGQGAPLRLALQVGAGWRVVAGEDGQRVTLCGAGGQALEYGKLVARDSAGSNLPARLAVDGERVVIEVEDARAAYPLTIDPLFTLQQRLTAADGAAEDYFGHAVALSGNMALIGAPYDDVSSTDQGSAYVFVRSGNTWTQQARLVAPDGAGYDYFGWSVALDGDTALIGTLYGPGSLNPDQGAAYVFVRGGTTWSLQKRLNAAPENTTGGGFGYSVALRGDRALIGAYSHQVSPTLGRTGVAYMFVRSGATWTQEQRLMPDDGKTDDQFGLSVALDGDTALIGAPGHDVGTVANQGAAYIFARTEGAWWPLRKLTAAVGEANDLFGSAVALSGDRALIGAPLRFSDDRGMAYIFENGAAGWVEITSFAPTRPANAHYGDSVALDGNVAVVGASLGIGVPGADQRSAYIYQRYGSSTWGLVRHFGPELGAPNDRFGHAVALRGDTVLIGAYLANAPANGQGAAYTFVLHDGRHVEQQKLVAGDGADGDYFGTAVALSGDTLAVGAPGRDAGTTRDQGAVYVFVRSGATQDPVWTLQQTLAANDGAAFDYFGYSVALDGDTLAVGASGDDIGGNANQGSAYIFTRSGTVWTLQQKLMAVAIDGLANDIFGRSIALSGDTVAVGAPGVNNMQGAAYVFRRNGAVWTQQQKIFANDGAADDYFGEALALSGDTLMAGAPHDTVGVNAYQGSVYFFSRSNAVWTQQQKIVAGDGAADNLFGEAVALSGDVLAVGAPGRKVGTNFRQGSAYLFGRGGANWVQLQQVTASNGAENDEFGLSVALDADMLVVGAYNKKIGNNEGQGSAYVFTRFYENLWHQQQQLTASDGGAKDYFGLPVAISGDTVVAGAIRSIINNLNQGSAYIYVSPRCPALTLDPASLPNAALGAPYEQPITLLGATVLAETTVTVSAGQLPPGLRLESLNDIDGVLRGTPTAPGSYRFTVTITQLISGCSARREYALTVPCPPITITPQALPAGRVGVAYVQDVVATGGLGQHSFALASGSLPPGLSLGGNGRLSGTPTQAGGYNFTVMAISGGCTATQAYTLTINSGSCPAITVNPSSLPAGTAGATYNQTLTASGGTAPYNFTVTAGALPGGLTLSTGGALTGTPAVVGDFNFTVTTTDAGGCPGAGAYTLTINHSTPDGLQFYPLAHPVRLLDTRAGLIACDAPGAPIAAGTSRTQTAAGRSCGGLTIPANARALVGNITTVQSGGGYLTLYPSDAAQPLVANSNYAANEVINNVFTVGLGAGDGAFKIFVTSDTHVVVDVTGYYAPPAAGGLYFHPLPKPIRLLETRVGFSGAFTPDVKLQSNTDTPQPAWVTYDGVTIPDTALAVVGNATTVNNGAGYLTLYPAGVPRPLAASSNFSAGQVMNAPFTVGLSATGEFTIFTTATTDLVIDVLGYYSADASDANGAGLLFNPLSSPVRLLETRAGFTGCFTPNAPLLAGSTRQQPARGVCAGETIAANALAVVGNATVINNQAGYLTFWPGGAAQPLVATSNFGAGQILNRHFTVGLGATGMFNIFASAQTDLIVDVSGFFAP